MFVDLQLLGSKLRKYRDQLKYSLAEASKGTGISEQFLKEFEDGKREPSGDQLLILADYYLCDYRYFVSNELDSPLPQTETLYRTHGDEFSREDRQAVQEFLYLCECEELLLGQIEILDRRPFHFQPKQQYFKDDGKLAARLLRDHLGHTANTREADIYNELRRIGLHVFRRQLANSRISGLFIQHPKAGRCVLVNYSEDIYRQRFTAAHEGGHAILDEDRDVNVSFDKWERSDLVEIRANTFASHFLLPPESLRLIPRPLEWDREKAIEWAGRFRVSTEALAYAMKDVKLIDAETTQIIKKWRVPNEKKEDPELPRNLSPKILENREKLLKRGLSVFYVGLCFKAYEANQISTGRLAEMLLCNSFDLPALAEFFGRSLAHAD